MDVWSTRPLSNFFEQLRYVDYEQSEKEKPKKNYKTFDVIVMFTHWIGIVMVALNGKILRANQAKRRKFFWLKSILGFYFGSMTGGLSWFDYNKDYYSPHPKCTDPNGCHNHGMINLHGFLMMTGFVFFQGEGKHPRLEDSPNKFLKKSKNKILISRYHSALYFFSNNCRF